MVTPSTFPIAGAMESTAPACVQPFGSVAKRLCAVELHRGGGQDHATPTPEQAPR